eukprot:TRINITY_DN20758_c0_g1_i5.p1 TRINITY_DN20758_c0_g1~~TRINITY_DN20758_c0_g1_i5.p1  ORF type:complete len:549 (-),score=86.66 TRINITY_DN20758_c0_g1_i5:291-1937(-)
MLKRSLLLLFVAAITGCLCENIDCKLPSSWWGIWFQQGVRPYMTIDKESISSKGACHVRHKDRVMVKKSNSCYKCIVIHRRHANVLQYKETLSCSPKPGPDLQTMCRTIPGDAPLYTLFRVDTHSIRCPIQGPLHFSYNFGRGLCAYPLSKLESCTLDTRISLKYQACPNVPGSEMKETQFECLAGWREGRHSFLVGKMENSHITVDEDKYRCIMWEKAVEEGETKIYLSISGDASCNGLFSTREGRALVLYPVNPESSCKFPSWLREGKLWNSLDEKIQLDMSEESASGLLLTRRELVDHGGRYYHQEETSNIICSSHRQESDDLVVMVNHETRGCTTGYVCTTFRKRDNRVAEMRMGSMAVTPEYACDKEYFTNSLPFHTIVGGESSRCPLSGRFSVSMKQSDFSLAVKPDILSTSGSATSACLVPYSLYMGCNNPSRRDMVFTACQGGMQESSTHTCITQWKEGEKQFFISRTASRARYACYSYREVGNMMVVDMMGQQCIAGEVGSFPFNITKISDCSDINKSDIICPGSAAVLFMVFLYVFDR